MTRDTRMSHRTRDDARVSTATGTSTSTTLTSATTHRDWPAAVAGIVAVATALGVSELLAGLLPGATSLVAAVGQVVIDLQPPGAKDVVVALFGTNDKLALELFIVAVALLIGAGLGLVARRRYAIAAAVVHRVRRRRVRGLAGRSAGQRRAWSRSRRPSRSGSACGSSAGCSTDRAEAAVDGDRRDHGRDARLVAPFVPHPGRRRRRRRGRRRGHRPEPARERQRTAPVGDGPADPAGVGHRPAARRPRRTCPRRSPA